MLDISHFVLSVISSSEALLSQNEKLPSQEKVCEGGGISQE